MAYLRLFTFWEIFQRLFEDFGDPYYFSQQTIVSTWVNVAMSMWHMIQVVSSRYDTSYSYLVFSVKVLLPPPPPFSNEGHTLNVTYPHLCLIYPPHTPQKPTSPVCIFQFWKILHHFKQKLCFLSKSPHLFLVLQRGFYLLRKLHRYSAKKENPFE